MIRFLFSKLSAGMRFASRRDPVNSITALWLRSSLMDLFAMLILPLAAAGYSLVYLLGGGGLFGALVIFVIAKMMRK
jgi:monomeric isocitrate dehydrogenase